MTNSNLACQELTATKQREGKFNTSAYFQKLSFLTTYFMYVLSYS